MTTELFNAIARRYDLANHVLSLGMDTGWRRQMTAFLPDARDLRVLDLATGTGDVAMILARDARVNSVVGIDPAAAMLARGREKLAGSALQLKIDLLPGDAMTLDFPDGHFDAVTVAFGVRNFPELMKGLAQAFRVIKPGGRIIILEFSLPGSFLVRQVHAWYLKLVVPLIGLIMTGQGSAYQYLSASIRAFPCGDRFGRILAQVGFQQLARYELALGAATVYVGCRKAEGRV